MPIVFTAIFPHPLIILPRHDKEGKMSQMWRGFEFNFKIKI